MACPEPNHIFNNQLLSTSCVPCHMFGNDTHNPTVLTKCSMFKHVVQTWHGTQPSICIQAGAHHNHNTDLHIKDPINKGEAIHILSLMRTGVVVKGGAVMVQCQLILVMGAGIVEGLVWLW